MGFNVDYETNSGSNFLVLTRESLDTRRLIGFQVEMLARNKIPGVVSLEVREKDAHVKLYYNLDGLVSLPNYLKKIRIAKREFLNILEKLVSVLVKSRVYYLDDASFVLREKYIYINPQSKEIYFIYIPVDMEQDFTGAVRTLLFDLVIGADGIDQHSLLVQQLLGPLKADEFNPAGFLQRLEELADGGYEPLLEPVGQPEESCNEPYYNLKLKHSRINKSKVIVGASVIAGLAAALWRWPLQGPVISTWTDRYGFYPLVSMLVLPALLTAGLYLKKSGRIRSGMLKRSLSAAEEGEHDLLSVVAAEEMEHRRCEAVTGFTAPDDTVFLGSAGCPSLVGIAGGEIILLNKPSFTLGRDREICDYAIEKPSIGRVHALINVIEGDFFITDLDSKNGTYINGEKLLSNKEYSLSDNDRVSLANVDFCFKTA